MKEDKADPEVNRCKALLAKQKKEKKKKKRAEKAARLEKRAIRLARLNHDRKITAYQRGIPLEMVPLPEVVTSEEDEEGLEESSSDEGEGGVELEEVMVACLDAPLLVLGTWTNLLAFCAGGTQDS